MTAMLPAHLTETLNNLGDAARALADEVRDDRAQRVKENRAVVADQHRQNRIMMTLLTIIVVLVVGLVTVAVQNRLRANQNAQIIRQTAATSAQIADCTTVGGKCYEQGGQRTANAIRMIIRAQIYITPCSKMTDTDAALEECVLHKLTENPAAATTPVVPAPSSTTD